MEVYRRLLDAYGPQHWWPGAETPIEVCIGAILTQSAAWTNVELALRRLREADALSLEGIHAATQEELAELVHASGYFNVKARKLKAFAQHVYDHHGGDLDAMLAQPWEPLREELLGIYGIGEETADDIVLYAAGAPSFVMDAYTRRILTRMGIRAPDERYEELSRHLHGRAAPRHPALQRVPRPAGPPRQGGLPQALPPLPRVPAAGTLPHGQRGSE